MLALANKSLRACQEIKGHLQRVLLHDEMVAHENSWLERKRQLEWSAGSMLA